MCKKTPKKTVALLVGRWLSSLQVLTVPVRTNSVLLADLADSGFHL